MSFGCSDRYKTHSVQSASGQQDTMVNISEIPFKTEPMLHT